MKKLLALSLFTLAVGGCAQTAPAVTHDTARQLNADRRYAHNSEGDIILGPSFTQEIVNGQYDVAGNVHVDPAPKVQPIRRF